MFPWPILLRTSLLFYYLNIQNKIKVFFSYIGFYWKLILNADFIHSSSFHLWLTFDDNEHIHFELETDLSINRSMVPDAPLQCFPRFPCLSILWVWKHGIENQLTMVNFFTGEVHWADEEIRLKANEAGVMIFRVQLSICCTSVFFPITFPKIICLIGRKKFFHIS